MSDGTQKEPGAGDPGRGTGMDPKLAGMLSYLLGFITGIIFLLVESDDRYVRFHAMQSTILFGGIFVAGVLLMMLPVIGWLINLMLIPVSFILWIVLMIKAYQGERFKLPLVGDLAEKQLG